MTLTNFFLLQDPHNGCMLPISSEPPLVKGQTFELTSQDVSGYERLDTKVAKWNIFKVFFINIHFFASAAASAAAAGLSAPARNGAVFRVCPAAEELHPIGDHVDGAPLGAVLGLPGTVLQATFDEYGVALLLVVCDGLAELSPGGDVEEVDLFVLGVHPIHSHSEPAYRRAALREPQFGIPGQITSQNDTVETDHFSFLLLCALQG